MQSSPWETPLFVNSRAAYPAATPPPRITYANALPISFSLWNSLCIFLFIVLYLRVLNFYFWVALALKTHKHMYTHPRNKKPIFNPKFLWCWQYLIYHTALLSSVLPDVCCIKMLTNQAEDMFWNINGLSGFDLEIPFLWTWG